MGYLEELAIIEAEEEAKRKAAAPEKDAEETEETADAEDAVAEDTNEEVSNNADDTESNADDEEEEEPAEEKTIKKGPFIQIPVLISIVIVLLSVIGYLVFNFFFLRVPQGVIWAKDFDGVTYYFEFLDNDVFKAYVGSVELTSTYQNGVYDGEDYLMVNADAGDFFSGQLMTYSITGSRILNNQELTITYDDEQVYTYAQIPAREDLLTPPDGFVPDEELLGSWVFKFYGYDYCIVTFYDDGLMKINYVENGVTYNGTYTIQDGNVNFTYYVKEYIAQPIEYKVDGDKLTFMEMEFTRMVEATPDEAK